METVGDGLPPEEVASPSPPDEELEAHPDANVVPPSRVLLRQVVGLTVGVSTAAVVLTFLPPVVWMALGLLALVSAVLFGSRPEPAARFERLIWALRGSLDRRHP